VNLGVTAPSGRQLGAALAPAGGKDRPSRPGPHPEAETVDPAAAPVARLERALAHGKTPYVVNLAGHRPPERGQRGGIAAVAATF
jgi:hypothetical protein